MASMQLDVESLRSLLLSVGASEVQVEPDAVGFVPPGRKERIRLTRLELATQLQVRGLTLAVEECRLQDGLTVRFSIK